MKCIIVVVSVLAASILVACSASPSSSSRAGQAPSAVASDTNEAMEMEVIPLKHIDAAGAAATLQARHASATIVAQHQMNAVVVKATSTTLKTIRDEINRLDRES